MAKKVTLILSNTSYTSLKEVYNYVLKIKFLFDTHEYKLVRAASMVLILSGRIP